MLKSYLELHSISSLKCGWDKWLRYNWTRLCKISWYLWVARRSTVCQSWKWKYILVDLRSAKKWRYYAITDNNWQKMGSMEYSVSVKMTLWWRNNWRNPIYTPASSHESKWHHNPSAQSQTSVNTTPAATSVAAFSYLFNSNAKFRFGLWAGNNTQ